MKITRKEIWLYGEEPKPVRRNIVDTIEIIIFIFISVIILSFISRIVPVIEFGLKSGFRRHVFLSSIIFLLISPVCVHFVSKAIGHLIGHFIKNHEIS